MSDLKTKQNENNVLDYLNSIEIEQRKSDCFKLLELFEETSGEKAKMWGKDIVGFGSYHYKGKSGREGEWFPLGFSSRKANLTIYMPFGFKTMEKELEKLGKNKTSVGCLYIKSLEVIDTNILKQMATKAYENMVNHKNS
ncbi:MAG: DUF1801 domain-containing protein [Flavobacteriales bacterium]